MRTSLAGLPSHLLLARVHELVRRGNAVEAELLAHLGEVDARQLYLAEGCSSMFHYCQRVLHFPEAVAYKRIQAARAARRHPPLLEAVRRGELHVTAVSLLAPRLTAENRSELIRAARHRSADEIRRLLADLEPKPEVPASVRRIPAAVTRAAAIAPTRSVAPVGAAGGGAVEPEPGQALPASSAGTAPIRWAWEAHTRTRAEPLGGERYHVQFTADRELHAQLQELRALMRHQIPDGDLGKILARAVALLLTQVRRRKFGECSTPRSSKPSKESGSRHIPAAIRRAVSRRDGERCSYVSAAGRRCEAREFLEFHHEEVWGRTKTHSIEGIALRCRAHNQYAARLDFGERHMARFGRRSGSGRDHATEKTSALEPAPTPPQDLDPVRQEPSPPRGEF